MQFVPLHDLLHSVEIFPQKSLVNPKIKKISFNSKDVEKGSLFLGLPGEKYDGGIFWREALNNGAEAAIISQDAEKITGKVNTKKVLVLNKPLSNVYGQIIAEFWNRPSSELKIIGVTGTNGKTTVTFLLEYLFQKLGKKTALFGTIFNRWPGHSEISSHTTDFADKLQPKLSAAKESEVEFVVMEVSSHSIAQKRISGCEFVGAIFTNLSQDHLDYHKNMKSYFLIKKELFKPPFLKLKEGFSVINADNEWGIKLQNDLESKCLMISTKDTNNKLKHKNYFYVSDKELTNSGSYCVLNTPKEQIKFFMPLVGEFNLMNALQAITLLYELGFPLKKIIKAIEEFPGVPGRMEIIKISNKKNSLPNVIIDYAHTPDGLSKVLESIKNFAEGKIITVFGCGGDRDSKKRSIMGSIAEELSDFIFITSDNPRTEDPQIIIDEILSGIKNKVAIMIDIDRYSAIKKAINFAKNKDIVLIAGKGHENYQILGNKIIDFDDKKIATYILNEKLNQ